MQHFLFEIVVKSMNWDDLKSFDLSRSSNFNRQKLKVTIAEG